MRSPGLAVTIARGSRRPRDKVASSRFSGSRCDAIRRFMTACLSGSKGRPARSPPQHVTFCARAMTRRTADGRRDFRTRSRLMRLAVRFAMHPLANAAARSRCPPVGDERTPTASSDRRRSSQRKHEVQVVDHQEDDVDIEAASGTWRGDGLDEPWSAGAGGPRRARLEPLGSGDGERDTGSAPARIHLVSLVERSRHRFSTRTGPRARRNGSAYAWSSAALQCHGIPSQSARGSNNARNPGSRDFFARSRDIATAISSTPGATTGCAVRCEMSDADDGYRGDTAGQRPVNHEGTRARRTREEVSWFSRLLVNFVFSCCIVLSGRRHGRRSLRPRSRSRLRQRPDDRVAVDHQRFRRQPTARRARGLHRFESSDADAARRTA